MLMTALEDYMLHIEGPTFHLRNKCVSTDELAPYMYCTYKGTCRRQGDWYQSYGLAVEVSKPASGKVHRLAVHTILSISTQYLISPFA